jgi:hypothetical protein
MNIKDAALRAVRTALQAFVGAAVLTNISQVADIKSEATRFAYAAAAGAFAGIVSFAQNLAEDNTSIPAVK